MRTVLAFVFVLLLPVAARAQDSDPIMARLSAEKPAMPESSLYSAGEDRQFILVPLRGKYLLRFADGGETFVLTADPGSLGAKLLKYDTGAAALSVSVWGGVTLYAADAPGGLPATRQGEAAMPAAAAISAADLKSALADEGSHFSYAANLGLRFALDGLPGDGDSRALAFDVLCVTQAGIERFVAAGSAARQALARRVATVRLEKSGKPGVSLSGRTLTVRYAPGEGFLGRVSSHAVAHQLGRLLGIPTAE